MIKSIYIIKNNINDKVYIGQSKNPHRRFIQHLCNGNRLLDSLPIHLAINKYGKENFYYEILEKDIENYNEREQYWISFYNSQSPNGYNISEGGQTNNFLKGEKHPRSKISDDMVDKIISDLIYTNKTQREIAKENSCSERIVNSINSGETRNRIELKYPIRNKFCHFSNITLEEIKWLLINTDCSFQSIADYYGLTKGTIAQINNGKIHHNSSEKYPLRENKSGIKISVEDIIKILFLKEENINE